MSERVKSKTLPIPRMLNNVQDEELDKQTDSEEVETKELVSINEKDVYYFDSASNLGIYTNIVPLCFNLK